MSQPLSNHQSATQAPFIPSITKFITTAPTHNCIDDQHGEIVTANYLPLCHANNMLMCASSVIGSRPEQQDRFVLAPSLLGGELSMFAVFDGTTGDHAAEWLRINCVTMLSQVETFQHLSQLSPKDKTDSILLFWMLKHLTSEFYKLMDHRLLEWCQYQSQTHTGDEQFKYDYTASTGVIAFIHHPSGTLAVSHVADSHAVVAVNEMSPQHQHLQQMMQQQKGQQQQQQQHCVAYDLTKPHKPDEQEELLRIQSCGGQLVYLHDSKPFIRGKDFRLRKKAIQLNYSRAFGSKDLKHSGLTSSPDIIVMKLAKPPGHPLAIAAAANPAKPKDQPDEMSQLTREMTDLNCDPKSTANINNNNAEAKLKPDVVLTSSDQFALDSPSIPITRMESIGQGRNVTTPGLDDIGDADDTSSIDGDNNNPTVSQQSPFRDNAAQLNSNTSDTSPMTAFYRTPLVHQSLHSLQDVFRVNHNPSLRVVQPSVDVRALIIGSDGVFDVLSPSECVAASLHQLNRTIHYRLNQKRMLAHIPINQTQQYLSENQDSFLPLKAQNLVSIYPDFVAYANWANDPSWNYSPADAVVAASLLQHEVRRSGDNVTALVVFF